LRKELKKSCELIDKNNVIVNIKNLYLLNTIKMDSFINTFTKKCAEAEVQADELLEWCLCEIDSNREKAATLFEEWLRDETHYEKERAKDKHEGPSFDEERLHNKAMMNTCKAAVEHASSLKDHAERKTKLDIFTIRTSLEELLEDNDYSDCLAE